MRRAAHKSGLSGDDGFSLSELLVVVSLLGVVIAAAYMFIYMVNRAQDNSNREAALSRAVGQPLLTMEKLIIQNAAIDPTTTGDYQLGGNQLRILTDRNSDNYLEQHTFSAVRDLVTGEGYVNMVSYVTDSSGARVGAAKVNGHIAFDNANVADGVVLFRYYDKDGAEITDMGRVSDNARSVVVQLRAKVDGSAETHSDTITFRNRK